MSLTDTLLADYLTHAAEFELILRNDETICFIANERTELLLDDSQWQLLGRAVDTYANGGDEVTTVGRLLLTAANKQPRNHDEYDRPHRYTAVERRDARLDQLITQIPDELLGLPAYTIHQLSDIRTRKAFTDSDFSFVPCYYSPDRDIKLDQPRLFLSLRDRIREFLGKHKQGAALPAFELTVNPSTGYQEVEFRYGSRETTFDSAIQTLEDILITSFLSYPRATPEKRFLRQQHASAPGDHLEIRNRLGALAMHFTLLSQRRFAYVLWIVSGCAEAEIGKLLESIHMFLTDRADTRPLLQPDVRTFGSIRLLGKSRAKSRNFPEYYEAIVGAAWNTLLASHSVGSVETPSVAHVFSTREDKDVIASDFEDSVAQGDLYLAQHLLVRWLAPNFARAKDVAKSFLEKFREIASGEAFYIYDIVSTSEIPKIVRMGKAESVANSLTSLFEATCRCLGVICERPQNILIGSQDNHFDICQSFLTALRELEKIPDFQRHIDFRSAAHNLDAYQGSTLETFCEGRSCLADILKIMLHKRYDVMVQSFEVIGSVEFGTVVEQLNYALIGLLQQASIVEGFCEPLIEVHNNRGHLVFNNTQSLMFSQFQQLFALQLFGVLTGKVVANDIHLTTLPSLTTNSAIDIFLSRLWNREFRSMQELIAAIDDFRANVVTYIVNFRERQNKSNRLYAMQRLKLQLHLYVIKRLSSSFAPVFSWLMTKNH